MSFRSNTPITQSLCLSYKTIHQCCSRRKEQLVLHWWVSMLLLKAFCQVLVLSNRAIHLSHSFRLQLLINNKPITRAKWTSGSLSSGYVLSGEKMALAPQEHHTELENESGHAKYAGKKNFQKRGVGWEWAFHTRAHIFLACLTNSSYKPTPTCNLIRVSSDLPLQIRHSVPSF